MASALRSIRLEIQTGAGPLVLLAHDDAEARTLRRRVTAWLEGAPDDFADVPIPDGTEFQRACWTACRSIPRGEVRTYAWLAAATGRPGAARAAGQAMRRNPLPVVVPCHRVVGTGAWVGGYAGDARPGSEMVAVKALLLATESGERVPSAPRRG